jgi:hypothetical protein
VITRRTTYHWLRAQVVEHSGGIAMIIGMGAHARRLLDQLHREFPSVVPSSPDGREHVAAIHDGSMTAIAWHRNEPGKPPIFELNDLRDPQGVFK